MSVKTNHKAKTVNVNTTGRHGVPKSLAEIDKHFKLWSASKMKTKLNLRSKFIQPIADEGTYARQALKKLQEFGKVIKQKVHR